MEGGETGALTDVLSLGASHERQRLLPRNLAPPREPPTKACTASAAPSSVHQHTATVTEAPSSGSVTAHG